MTTTFNRDELKLISRALNFYGDHPEYMSEDRYVTEPVEAKSLATRIYRENFRIGMENEPPRPLPSQDYNEYLIDQDGNAQHVVVDIASAGGKRQIVRFTNVPMHHVHAAIALLNDDGQDALPAGYESLAHKLAANKLYGDVANQENPLKKFYPPYVAEGTKEFTMLELFPDVEKFKPRECCVECGAFVPYEQERQTHVTWHNKTLP